MEGLSCFFFTRLSIKFYHSAMFYNIYPSCFILDLILKSPNVIKITKAKLQWKTIVYSTISKCIYMYTF